MNDKQLLTIVEQYSRKIETGFGEIKVTRIPDRKTMYVEKMGGEGDAIMLNEYKIDGRTYWAGYSSLSQTVYISLAN